MEVHHHPDVEKKSFKQYLLEGLMIFLAVTMGFIAESIRENITKNDKENDYITSLVNNLEKDKTTLANTITFNQKKMRGLDSLLSLSSRDMKVAANRGLLYKYARYISYYAVFISSDATMTQLKNAGGLQFIRRDHVADSIAKYDGEVRGIYASEPPYLKYLNDGLDAEAGILIIDVKNGMAKLENDSYQPFPLLTNDRQRLQIFFNKIKIEWGWTNNYVNNLQQRLPYLTRLITLLKNEYDIN